MRTPRLFRPDQEGGQALVILAISMSALLAMSALIIDGGNAMAQQRATQNGADAASLSGATVLIEGMGGASRSDADVLAAVQQSLTINDSNLDTAVYVDYANNVVGTVGGGSIPGSAGGVQVTASRTFGTFLAGLANIPTLESGATATALAGAIEGVCAAVDGCAVIPVTFSIPVLTCTGTNAAELRVGELWPLVNLEDALADSSGSLMSVVPLCTTGPGGVGWLDMADVGCPGNNLESWISTPCNESFDIPLWLKTKTGNMNNVENALNAYAGQVVLVPMFGDTCREVPFSGLPQDCTDPGNGDNLWYHIPQFAAFLIHEAYIQGNDGPACNSAPGQPMSGGNGSTSCIKGWFVSFVTVGPVGPVGGEVGANSVLATQLVR